MSKFILKRQNITVQKDSEAKSCLSTKEDIEERESSIQKHMFNIEIDLGGGNIKNINIFESSSPLTVAEDFCSENHLNPEISNALSKIITEKKQLWRKQSSSPQSCNALNNKTNYNYISKFSPRNLKEIDQDQIKNQINKNKMGIEASSRLYKDAIYKRVKNKNLAELELKQRKENETKGVTFHPKINNSPCSKFSENVEDRLLNYGLVRNKKLEDKRNFQNIIDSQCCTFHPEINIPNLKGNLSKSYRIIDVENQNDKSNTESEIKVNKGVENVIPKNRNFNGDSNSPRSLILLNRSILKEYYKNKEKDITFSDRFYQLYNYSLFKKMNFENANNLNRNSECTFTPKINKNSKRRNSSLYLEMAPFYNSKLYESKKNFELKFSFTPKTGRDPHNARNTNNLPIGEYLYSQRNSISKGASNKNKEVNEKKEERLNSFVNSFSKTILEKRRFESFHKIFKLLDSDEDGKISSIFINIDCILN